MIDGESTSNLANQSATINAEVNPFDVDTTCMFQYQTTRLPDDGHTYAHSAPCTPADLSPTFEDHSASVTMTSLTINTMYDFRVVATNADGTTDGAKATFTTLGPAMIDSESTPTSGQRSPSLTPRSTHSALTRAASSSTWMTPTSSRLASRARTS